MQQEIIKMYVELKILLEKFALIQEKCSIGFNNAIENIDDDDCEKELDDTLKNLKNLEELQVQIRELHTRINELKTT